MKQGPSSSHAAIKLQAMKLSPRDNFLSVVPAVVLSAKSARPPIAPITR